MLVDEILGDREPQSAAIVAPGNQRIENALADRFRDAGPVVDHLQCDPVAIALACQRDLPGDARPQTDLALALQCLGGVAHDIEHRLDQLLLVALQGRQTRVVIALDRDARILGEDDAAHALEHLVDVEQRRPRQPMRRKQSIHQRLQPVRFLHDDLGILVQVGAFELAIQELCRAADAAERILDLVRQVADELPVGLALVEQAFLTRDPELLLDVAELEQETAVMREFHRRHRTRKMQPAATGNAKREVMLGIAAVVVAGIAGRRSEFHVVTEQLGEREAGYVRAAEFKQVFGCRVHVLHDQLSVHQHHRRGE